LKQSTQQKFSIELFNETAHAGTWDMLCLQSEFGWCWHSRLWKKFVVEISEKRNTTDLSFLVFDEGKAVGLCSLLVMDIERDNTLIREASYAGGALPWPCIDPGYTQPFELLQYIFKKAEEMSVSNNAQYIKFSCTAPGLTNKGTELIHAVMLSEKYIDSSFDSSLVNPDNTDIHTIRERYKRYIGKFSKVISTEVIDNDIPKEIEEAYFLLHVKDAGKQYRSRESYHLFCNLVKEKEAFMIVAREKITEKIVGVLIVSLFKNAAFDSSVAVDPDYADQYVSHLLKWEAIQYLKNKKIIHYELGEKKLSSKMGSPVSEKEHGITNFKEGWARGLVKRNIVAEKYLNKDIFILHMEKVKQAMHTLWFESVKEKV
jgi:hypothetical protein